MSPRQSRLFRSPSTSRDPSTSRISTPRRRCCRGGSSSLPSPAMSMMPSMRRLLLAGAAVAAVVVSCAVVCAEASVHEYAGERFAGVGNGFVLHGGSEGVYASATAESFVRFEKVAFRRTPEAASVAEEDGNRTVTVAAVIFEAGDRDAVGGSDVGGERALCCTPGMARLGGCTEGAVVYRAAPAASGWPKVLAASFLPGSLVAAFPDETVAVARTGMYSLQFVHCDPSLAAGQVVAAEGKTIWKNSRGYLPGRMAPLKPFYGGMSLAFAALAALWFVRYARFWREVSPLQNFATAAIALGMVEVTTWYLDLAEFDVSGVRPAGTTFWAATSGAVRGAACRVLALLVAMGYGVTRPALGCANAKVAILGAAFLAAAEVLDVGENVGIVSDHSPTRRLFFILPVAVLNTVFIYWIFTSLSRTISKLKARRMTAKLEMYRKFANSLTIAVALSLGWITFEVHFKTTDEHNERWRVAWVIPTVWELISFFLLCVICLLWAPSQNSMRFAYSGEEGEDDTEHDDEDDDMEDTRPLIRAGPLSYVDNWACYVTQDAKIILRTDSGVYAKAGEEYKRV